MDSAAGNATGRKIAATGAVFTAIIVSLWSVQAAGATGTARITGNWAGYEQTPPSGVTYTAVRATFTVPTVPVGSACPTGGTGGTCAKSSTWVGIGGDPATVPLVQTGTEADLHTDGGTSYWAWAEIVPDNPNTQHQFSVKVQPGDGVTATVRETAPGTWAMTVKDLTTGKSGSRTVTNYSLPANASVEAIHERTGIAPLTPTTNVIFDHAQYSTSAPGATPSWVPFFKLPAGAVLYDEQMCNQEGTTNSCPPPAQIAATPSNADSDHDGFAVADGPAGPPPPPSLGGTFTAAGDQSINYPAGIVRGPDGAMWFANREGNAIGRIGPGGSVTEYTDSQMDYPGNLAVGPDGALWFTEFDGIGRITVSGTITHYPDSRVSAYDITAGPDGALWFTNFDNTTNKWSIGRITTSGSYSFYYDSTLDTPYGITTGPDGALWFVNQGNCQVGASTCGSIGRITTAGVVSNYTNPSINNPDRITAGPDGALWFTNEYNGSIGRITTAGAMKFYPITPLGDPQGITAGPDGALWFTIVATPKETVGRISTSGHMSIYYDAAISYGGSEPPGAIAVGSDGRLWFDYPATSNAIYQITVP